MSGTKWLQKQEHFDWMQKCLACWRACEEFIAWSIENKKYLNTIGGGRDATEMCSQCIKFEAQRSLFFYQLCEVCAEICGKFSNDLEKLQNESETISETVNACKVFVEACRKMANQSGEPGNFADSLISNQDGKSKTGLNPALKNTKKTGNK